MTTWSRLAMVRSSSRISAIFASTAFSPSPLSAPGPRRAAAFSSWMRSLIAPCSSSVNPLNFLLILVGLLADFCVPFVAGFMEFYSSSALNYSSRVHSLRFNQLRWALVVGNRGDDQQVQGQVVAGSPLRSWGDLVLLPFDLHSYLGESGVLADYAGSVEFCRGRYEGMEVSGVPFQCYGFCQDLEA